MYCKEIRGKCVHHRIGEALIVAIIQEKKSTNTAGRMNNQHKERGTFITANLKATKCVHPSFYRQSFGYDPVHPITQFAL